MSISGGETVWQSRVTPPPRTLIWQALAVVYERKLEQQAGKLQAGEQPRGKLGRKQAGAGGARQGTRRKWGGSLGWIDEAFEEAYFVARATEGADEEEAAGRSGGVPRWRRRFWRRRPRRGGGERGDGKGASP